MLVVNMSWLQQDSVALSDGLQALLLGSHSQAAVLCLASHSRQQLCLMALSCSMQPLWPQQ